MSKQPEALRLAQDLDAYHMRAEHKQAAAELRRQHALIAELVEVIEKLAHYSECQVAAFSSGRCYLDMTMFPALCESARAAIAKAVQQ